MLAKKYFLDRDDPAFYGFIGMFIFLAIFFTIILYYENKLVSYMTPANKAQINAAIQKCPQIKIRLQELAHQDARYYASTGDLDILLDHCDQITNKND